MRYHAYRLSAILIAPLAACAGQEPRAVADSIAGGVSKMAASIASSAAPKPADISTPQRPSQERSRQTGGSVHEMFAQNILIGGSRSEDPRWRGVSLKSTNLNGLFKDHPIVPGTERWPRVALEITDYSETLVANPFAAQNEYGTKGSKPRPSECVKFNATIWRGEKKSEQINGIVFCNYDIDPSTMMTHSFMGMQYYKEQIIPMPSISSGQLRTKGPKVPNRLVPTETAGDNALYSNGRYLFSPIFYVMAYRGPMQELDPRV